MTLLEDVQTLLGIWFPNKEDDEINYDTWSSDLILYSQGRLLVSENTINQQTKDSMIIVTGNGTQQSAQYFRSITVGLRSLTPSPSYHNNQQMTITVNDEVKYDGKLGSISDPFSLWGDVGNGGFPVNPVLNVVVNIKDYVYNEDTLYTGVRYSFSVSSNNHMGHMSCSVVVG